MCRNVYFELVVVDVRAFDTLLLNIESFSWRFLRVLLANIRVLCESVLGKFPATNSTRD